MSAKLFSILLSTFILVQSFNIHIGDLLKVDELIEHANMHKEKYGDDFLVFISKHYGDLKESHKLQHEEEEKDHSHFPIDHECSSQIPTSFILNRITFSITTPQARESEFNFYYQDNHSTFEKQKIFQPPQFV